MSTYLTIKQLSDKIGCRNTVYHWIKCGLLPRGKTVKMGRAWMQVWTLDQVDGAIIARELGSEEARNEASRPGDSRSHGGAMPLSKVAEAARRLSVRRRL